jgi:hypothetical protein
MYNWAIYREASLYAIAIGGKDEFDLTDGREYGIIVALRFVWLVELWSECSGLCFMFELDLKSLFQELYICKSGTM